MVTAGHWMERGQAAHSPQVQIEEMNAFHKSTWPADLDEYPSAFKVNIKPCLRLPVLYTIAY